MATRRGFIGLIALIAASPFVPPMRRKSAHAMPERRRLRMRHRPRVVTWNRHPSSDAEWNNPDNWSPRGVPMAGDTILFKTS